MPTLYIAYGSNLCKHQMRQRCPDARPIGRFILAKARLVFRGVADLEFDETAGAACGLWSISQEDEKALDRYEGVSIGSYFKSREIILNFEGRRRRALLYSMNSTAIYPPSQTYLNTIRRGYRDFGLDERYLDEAVAHSHRNKQHDEGTKARRARQLETNSHRELAADPSGGQ